MNDKKLYFSLALVTLLLGFGAWLAMFFQWTATQPRIANSAVSNSSESVIGSGPLFNPPGLEEAPESIREQVMLGYKIMTETQKYAGEYVGNNLACTNCHFDGGRSKNTLSLVGVGAKYPAYRGRREYTADLALRTQGCFERSMNGKAPAPDSQIMQSLLVYYQWISKGVPIYSNPPWLGIPHDLGINSTPDVIAGKKIYEDVCARCHGNDGYGTPIAPPLWGDGSFNDGAGMNRVRTFSVFSWRFMPKSAPTLTKEEALNVTAYVHEQPRPKFIATHPNKIKRVIKLPVEASK
ncbi:c-type cytochrome [Desulfovibrio gilichinskyi]|uniref:Thiosulfate dehydrogenase n=1 Tax=Desulfovibrio gilichinskyi TaxID=1519643 RepID=A0A1X7E771_9BACT|nr:c-type cytochrome [Desulfovibrio gilichinskyi]SMF28818.1 thiosulfate dehydrogenase [Desulfovibrio gilichinskyi]